MKYFKIKWSFEKQLIIYRHWLVEYLKACFCIVFNFCFYLAIITAHSRKIVITYTAKIIVEKAASQSSKLIKLHTTYMVANKYHIFSGICLKKELYNLGHLKYTCFLIDPFTTTCCLSCPTQCWFNIFLGPGFLVTGRFITMRQNSIVQFLLSKWIIFALWQIYRFQAKGRYTVFKVILERHSNKCGQLFITPEETVSHQIIVCLDV